MQQQPGGDSHHHSRYVNYGGYMNFGADASNGGTISYYQVPAPTVLNFLAPHVVHDALYNSGKRRDEHAVTCQIETRDKILNAIRLWAGNPTTPPICWLSGPAGTGKTTVAHTIAEEYEKCGRLAATFFWRRTGDRDDIKKLVPTLAYQIAKKIPSAKEQMEELRESPLPFAALSLEDQLSTLLGISVHPADRSLVVIDGLDECTSPHGIYRLIEWVRKNKTPFRFLFTSRPEPEIKAHFTFGLGDGDADVRTLSLTESEDDIRKYFVERLEKVWPTQQRVTAGGPRQWPSQLDLTGLVMKSEGLFEYAAMSVRYISGKGSPENRLKGLLTLRNGLDYLYAQVIEEAKEWEYFDIVVGSLMYLRRPLSVDDLSSILLALNEERLTNHGIRYALHGCHSILLIDDHSPIRPYHASLRDFLTDQSRSGTLIPAPVACHGRLMVGCLAAVTRAFNNGTLPPEYATVSWHFHALRFLSAGAEGLEELADKTQDLVEGINLMWVKSWMIAAIRSSGRWNLANQFPPIKVRKNYMADIHRHDTGARISQSHFGLAS